jgi:hypothetical protein
MSAGRLQSMRLARAEWFTAGMKDGAARDLPVRKTRMQVLRALSLT